MPEVKGLIVDAQTRCKHYASANDIVAIKFYCCRTYYPCYRCHESCADHPIERWPAAQFGEPAILCGVCKSELSIRSYLALDACPCCHSAFNPRCRDHHAIYFDL